jgi:predicted nucleic acid-binding Zn ribbon protein
MNVRRARKCIDCGNDLNVQESNREGIVVCDECIMRIKRQFWAAMNINIKDKKPWMKKKEDDSLTL